MVNVLHRQTVGNHALLVVDAVPSGGGGVTALPGSLAIFNDAGTGRDFRKTGTGDTAWTELTATADLSTATGTLGTTHGGTGQTTYTSNQVLVGTGGGGLAPMTLTSTQGIDFVFTDPTMLEIDVTASVANRAFTATFINPTVGDLAVIYVPFDCTLTGWDIVDAAVSGSIVVDVWNDVYASFPPTIADTIAASAKPTLSSQQKNTNSTLTGWTTSLAAGSYLFLHVDSVSTVTQVVVALKVTAA